MSLSVLERLKAENVTVSSISKRFNVSERAVYYSIDCSPTGSRQIRLYISTLLSTPPSLLFSSLPSDIKLIDDSFFMFSLVSSYMDDLPLVKTCKNSVHF